MASPSIPAKPTLSEKQLLLLDEIVVLLKDHAALADHFDAVHQCSDELKLAVFHKILEFCPVGGLESWMAWNAADSGTKARNACEKFGLVWTGLEEMDELSAIQEQQLHALRKLGMSCQGVVPEDRLCEKAIPVWTTLAKMAKLKYGEDSKIFSLEQPSANPTARILDSCFDVEMKIQALSKNAAKSADTTRPWNAIHSAGNSGASVALFQFMHRAFAFFKLEHNRSLSYVGVLTDMQHFFFLKTGRNGILQVSNPYELKRGENGDLPLRIILKLLGEQKEFKMKAGAGFQKFNLRPDFERFAQPNIVTLHSSDGSAVYLKAVGTLGATKKSLILACTEATDMTDWTSPNARLSDLFCLKVAGAGNMDAVKCLDVEEFHLKKLDCCPCVPHVIRKGSLLWESTGCVGLLLDTVGVPLDHLDVSSLNVDDFKTLWSAMTSAVSQVHAFGIVHGDLKPSHFILTRSGINIVDFDSAITSWSHWLFPSDEGEFPAQVVVRFTTMFASPSLLLGDEEETATTTIPTAADDLVSSAYSLIALMIEDSDALFTLPEGHQKNLSSLVELVRNDCKELAAQTLAQVGLISLPSNELEQANNGNAKATGNDILPTPTPSPSHVPMMKNAVEALQHAGAQIEAGPTHPHR